LSASFWVGPSLKLPSIVADGPADRDQLKTFSIVDVSVSFCRDLTFGSCKLAGQFKAL
jgi:hypothetical protein